MVRKPEREEIKMFFKWFLICCICLSVGGLGAYLSGTNPEVTEQVVTLVLDVPADMQSPDNFRTAEIILLALIEGNSTINRQGLDTLSGQEPDHRGTSSGSPWVS